MKKLTETRIYLALLTGFMMLLTAAVIYGQATQQMLTAKIKDYQPLVVDQAQSKHQSYDVGETIIGVFTGERFTTSGSVINRQIRCSNGFRYADEFPVAGRPTGAFINAELHFIRVPAGAGGICNFRFSERFDEIIEGREVSKTVPYQFDFEVLQ